MITILGLLFSMLVAVALNLAVNFWYGTGPISWWVYARRADFFVYYFPPAFLFAIWVAILVRYAPTTDDRRTFKRWVQMSIFSVVLLAPVAFIVGRPDLPAIP